MIGPDPISSWFGWFMLLLMLIAVVVLVLTLQQPPWLTR